MEERMNYLPLICTLVGAAGVLFALIIAVVVKGAPAGNEKMQEIATAIKEGAIAYLNRQLKSMGIAGAIIFVIIIFALGVKTALGFLLGAIASFVAGYIGMRVSVLANVRTAEAAKGGLSKGLSMAFKGGSVTGMIVAGLALTAVAGYYSILISMGTWSVRSKPESPKTIPETRRPLPIMSVIMWATVPVWRPTFLKLTPSPPSPPCFWAT
jgi:K(+)-stimulated pyrophosphate-energized sodium pump